MLGGEGRWEEFVIKSFVFVKNLFEKIEKCFGSGNLAVPGKYYHQGLVTLRSSSTRALSALF